MACIEAFHCWSFKMNLFPKLPPAYTCATRDDSSLTWSTANWKVFQGLELDGKKEIAQWLSSEHNLELHSHCSWDPGSGNSQTSPKLFGSVWLRLPDGQPDAFQQNWILRKFSKRNIAPLPIPEVNLLSPFAFQRTPKKRRRRMKAFISFITLKKRTGQSGEFSKQNTAGGCDRQRKWIWDRKI